MRHRKTTRRRTRNCKKKVRAKEWAKAHELRENNQLGPITEERVIRASLLAREFLKSQKSAGQIVEIIQTQPFSAMDDLAMTDLIYVIQEGNNPEARRCCRVQVKSSETGRKKFLETVAKKIAQGKLAPDEVPAVIVAEPRNNILQIKDDILSLLQLV